ncbi:MAG: hypothetical protein V7K53_01460 [Nostoc sp.]|uniref:hypothetical protein n=1 Tax=unclassified Nostoc TaxID=2593658 RepID=UPI002237ADA2|nr:hypothetical protein [Nostoc sp. KVJ3]
MTKRNRLPTAIAEIIEPPKIITSPPEIGYWIDTSRIGVKPCAKIRFTSKLLEKPLLRENLKFVTGDADGIVSIVRSFNETVGVA